LGPSTKCYSVFKDRCRQLAAGLPLLRRHILPRPPLIVKSDIENFLRRSPGGRSLCFQTNCRHPIKACFERLCSRP